MESNQAENRRAQTASEPDWSFGSGSSTTALPKFSDTEFSHLDREVVQQMEDVFGPTPTPAPSEPENDGGADAADDDTSFVSDGMILITARARRARTQVAEALRLPREGRDSSTE
jgi:hypothetical protein